MCDPKSSSLFDLVESEAPKRKLTTRKLYEMLFEAIVARKLSPFLPKPIRNRPREQKFWRLWTSPIYSIPGSTLAALRIGSEISTSTWMRAVHLPDREFQQWLDNKLVRKRPTEQQVRDSIKVILEAGGPRHSDSLYRKLREILPRVTREHVRCLVKEISPRPRGRPPKRGNTPP